MSGGNFDGTSFDSAVGGFDVDAAPIPDTTDTHDGFDEHSHKRVKDEQSAKDREFLSRRQRLRSLLEQAWGEPDPGPVAAEVKAIASPYVERLESGNLRVDYKALQKKQAMADLLTFQDDLRAEYAARIAAFEADEEDIMILTMAL